jgi:diguanylate cyclase (GGDEF)-like protein/PAS domain S-box-containing protein
MAFRAETESITERCLRRAFDDAPIAQAILSARPDDRGRFVDVNPQLAALLDRTPAELLGRSLADFLSDRDRHAVDDLLRRLLTTHESVAQEFELISYDRTRRILVSASLVRDDEGRPDHMVATVEDAGRRWHAEARLVHRALHDNLTGLPNRLLFNDRVSRALSRTRAGLVAVLLLDIDRFKLVNASMGHSAGDQVLTEMASRLRAAAGHDATLARLGSDEFMVLVEDLSSPADALAIAERIEEATSSPLIINGTELFLTASIGIATDDGRGHRARPENLLRAADTAVQFVKDLGTGGHAVYDESMRTEARGRLEVGARLQRAIERHELRVLFQPIHSLLTGRIIGAEALVRWHHPEWGRIPPLEFLPVAEETGSIVSIGAFVLDTACAEAREWQRRGNDLVVAVNLSARELCDPELADRVAEILARRDLDPSRLCLEITESVLVDAFGAAGATAQALRNLGVSLAIDDFGTGYSSLAYVKQFPVDTIKVDRSFVEGIENGDRDAAIFERIADLGHVLDMTCVAEGVETRGQLDRLREMGCDAAQGFLLGRPVDAPTLTARLDGRRRAAPVRS